MKNFRGKLSSIWKDRVAGQAFRYSLFFSLALFLIIFAFFWRLPPEIPFFYSRPWGADQLVKSHFLFVVFMITLFFLLINTIIASLLLPTQELLARILCWANTIFIFLIDITVLRVVLLVT